MKITLLPRAVAVLGLVVATLVVFSPSEANASLGDGPARARLEEMERNGVLRDPSWAHAFWARSRNAPTADARVADLRWSLCFDPELNQARWELAGALLSQRNSEFATHILEAFSQGVRSFPGQHRLMVWIITLTMGAIGLTMVVLSMLAIAKVLPRIQHGVRERLHFLPIEVRSAATLLSVALPLLLAITLAPTAALFWAILLGTVGAWTLLDRWERRTCVATLALVLLAPVALAGWSRIVAPGHPTSYLQSLWATQSGDDDARANTVRVLASGDGEGAEYWASLALVERRAGNFKTAAAHLNHSIQLDPGEWAYMNNLGNVQLLAGRTDAALRSYDKAHLLAPNEPLVSVNEAQAWVQKLEFARADQALAKATSLGYRIPPMLNTSAANVIVRDHTLVSAALWDHFANSETVHGALPAGRVVSMMFAILLPVKPMWMSLPFLLAIWYAALVRFLPRAFNCSSCGKAICRKCHYRVMRRSLCSHCYAIRQDVQAPLQREEMLADRRRRTRRVGRSLALIVSAIMPGSGMAMRGQRRRGILLMVLATLVYGAASADLIWPDPSAAGSHSHPIVPIVLLSITYALLAAMSIRGYLSAPISKDSSAPPKPPAPEVA